jgi:Ca-activated chloride channel family protein
MKTILSMLTMLAMLQTQLEVNVQLRQRVVTVRDRAGQIARGLKAEDFVLEEDGEAQPIRHFTEDSETPVALGFLLDVSDSMALKLNKETKETRLSAAVAASQLLIRSMKPGDEFLLMTVSTTLSVRENLTKDPRKVEDRLVKLQASGRSHLVPNLEKAMKELRKSTHRKRALVIFTDGEVSGERDHTRKFLENAEMLIYTFAINETSANLAPIGPAWMSTIVTGTLLSENQRPVPMLFGDEVLKLLAGASGGRSEVFANASGRTVSRVQDFAKDIAAELRGQYTIGYYPNTSRSSIQPTVRIRAKSPEYQVRMQRNPIEIVE